MKNLRPRIKLIDLLAAASLTLSCFALSPQARAACEEGCDPVNFNTFFGEDALLDHSGISNTAVGWHALMKNSNHSWNTAIGTGALENNSGGYDNTATGVAALGDNTTGHSNTATGSNALSLNTTGFDNTATGFASLLNNQTGGFNVANGMWALSGNTDGDRNTATGYNALTRNTTGRHNTATGYGALAGNTTGRNNIALGDEAGGSLTTGNKNIDIGNAGLPGESSTIRIGTVPQQSATFIAGISGATVPTGITVIVDADGHLGTMVSSARFKEAIKPMGKASEAILALEPVTFRYKQDLDHEGTPQFGLVAEEVDKVNPNLVARDAQGKPYGVRYEAVNAMLLNEFLKEHGKVEALEATVGAQQKRFESEIAALTATLKAQESQIRNVSDQLRAPASSPRMVANDVLH